MRFRLRSVGWARVHVSIAAFVRCPVVAVLVLVGVPAIVLAQTAPWERAAQNLETSFTGRWRDRWRSWRSCSAD